MNAGLNAFFHGGLTTAEADLWEDRCFVGGTISADMQVMIGSCTPKTLINGQSWELATLIGVRSIYWELGLRVLA